eukprot:61269-Rhodomonas_salina.8
MRDLASTAKEKCKHNAHEAEAVRVGTALVNGATHELSDLHSFVPLTPCDVRVLSFPATILRILESTPQPSPPSLRP